MLPKIGIKQSGIVFCQYFLLFENIYNAQGAFIIQTIEQVWSLVSAD
jgi:hypothetical protein